MRTLSMKHFKSVIPTTQVTKVKTNKTFKLLFLMRKLIKQLTIKSLTVASTQKVKHTNQLEMKQFLQAILKPVLQGNNSQLQEIVILRGTNKFQQQQTQLKKHLVSLVRVLSVKNWSNFKVEQTTTM